MDFAVFVFKIILMDSLLVVPVCVASCVKHLRFGARSVFSSHTQINNTKAATTTSPNFPCVFHNYRCMTESRHSGKVR